MIGCGQLEAWATFSSRGCSLERQPWKFRRERYVSFTLSNLQPSKPTTSLSADRSEHPTRGESRDFEDTPAIVFDLRITIKSRPPSQTAQTMSASSARGHYTNPPLEDEDDDLIDPDDGM